MEGGSVLFAVGTAVRWGTFAAMTLVVGVVVYRRFVQENGSPLAVARVGAWSAAVLAPLALARFGVLLVEFHDPFETWGESAALLATTPTARVWAAQAVVALLTAVFFARSWWVPAGVGAVALAFAPALSGHAMAVSPGTTWAVLLDGAHVVAAGAWLGGLALVAAHLRRAPSGEGFRIVRRFSPVALVGAGVAVASGVGSTLLHVDPFAVPTLLENLWVRALAAKTLAVVGLMALGFHNWRRATPALGRTGDPGPIRRTMTAELWVAAAVLLLAAVLVVMPPPTR